MAHHHADRPILPASALAREIAAGLGPFTLEAVGNISQDDAAFLLTLIERERPGRILELGVASGTSALMMLALLERLEWPTRLDSVDLLDTYYADPTKPVGYLVPAWFGRRPARWRVLSGTGAAGLDRHRDLRDEVTSSRYDFAFIDANHAHPWPTLDLLCTLPFLQPGAWVAFHDVNLPLLGPYPQFGAVHVIRDWPGEVLISEDPRVPNTAAIRLGDAGPLDAERMIPALRRAWDVPLSSVETAGIRAHLERHLPRRVVASIRGEMVRAARRD